MLWHGILKTMVTYLKNSLIVTQAMEFSLGRLYSLRYRAVRSVDIGDPRLWDLLNNTLLGRSLSPGGFPCCRGASRGTIRAVHCLSGLGIGLGHGLNIVTFIS